MKRTEIEALLRDHVRGVHDELANLFRGIERALDQHLERTESMIADTFASEKNDNR
jgi:hypothetical protein